MNAETMDTFLPPVENPRGLMMKLAYYFTRKQFGKVLAPVKVFSARLPSAFGMFYGKVGKLDKKLTLSPEMILLVRHQVARLNVCLFCMDTRFRSFGLAAFVATNSFRRFPNGSSPYGFKEEPGPPLLPRHMAHPIFLRFLL